MLKVRENPRTRLDLNCRFSVQVEDLEKDDVLDHSATWAPTYLEFFRKYQIIFLRFQARQKHLFQIFNYTRTGTRRGKPFEDVIGCKIRGLRPKQTVKNSFAAPNPEDGTTIVKVEGCDF